MSYPPRLPSFESLRIFEACARHGNFTRAADELGVTAAAVSLRVRGLEQELTIELFRRLGPKVTLTPAGATLATRMSAIIDRLRAAVDECQGALRPLRFTVVPTIATRWLGLRLEKYQRLTGALPIKLDVSTEIRPIDSFDVAIRSGAGEWPHLISEPLFPLQGSPMLSPKLAGAAAFAKPTDLAQFPLLPDERWSQWFRETGATPKLQFASVEYPTQELAACAALQGQGVALLSPTLFGSLLHQGLLLQPFPHIVEGPDSYHVVVQKDERREAVLDLVALLKAEARSGSPTTTTASLENSSQNIPVAPEMQNAVRLGSGSLARIRARTPHPVVAIKVT